MNRNSLKAFFKDCNPFNMFLSKAEREVRNKNLGDAAEHLAIITDPNKSKDIVQAASLKLNELIKGLNPERKKALIKSIPSDSILDSEHGKDFKLPENASFKEIVFHFFGMDKNWKLGRNLAGGFMVHAPEYPTYFIPAFTQARATGDATEMKKGEGPRGIITGMLEGVAIGALVSGRAIKPAEWIPYIFLGAALQLFSSKVFPWLGEKMGRQLYLRRQESNKSEMAKSELQNPDVSNPVKESVKSTQKPETPAFKGRYLYNNYSTGLRI